MNANERKCLYRKWLWMMLGPIVGSCDVGLFFTSRWQLHRSMCLKVLSDADLSWDAEDGIHLRSVAYLCFEKRLRKVSIRWYSAKWHKMPQVWLHDHGQETCSCPSSLAARKASAPQTEQQDMAPEPEISFAVRELQAQLGYVLYCNNIYIIYIYIYI